MVEELVLSGADIVKVGIGPGKFQLNHKFNTIYHFKNLFLTLIWIGIFFQIVDYNDVLNNYSN